LGKLPVVTDALTQDGPGGRQSQAATLPEHISDRQIEHVPFLGQLGLAEIFPHRRCPHAGVEGAGEHATGNPVSANCLSKTHPSPQLLVGSAGLEHAGTDDVRDAAVVFLGVFLDVHGEVHGSIVEGVVLDVRLA